MTLKQALLVQNRNPHILLRQVIVLHNNLTVLYYQAVQTQDVRLYPKLRVLAVRHPAGDRVLRRHLQRPVRQRRRHLLILHPQLALQVSQQLESTFYADKDISANQLAALP